MARSFNLLPLFASPKETSGVIARWRRRAKSGPHTPLVVLLHGRGADEHDLSSVADRLPSTFSYVSVRGFVGVEGGGFTWFENRGAARPIATSLRASVIALRAWLDQVAPQPAPCFLLGFSAGMMMAGALALDEPQRFRGAVLLSGALALESGIPAEPGRLRTLPVFYARGSHDDVIPAALVKRTETYLRDTSGAQLTFREYDCAHSIVLREIADIAIWLGEHR